MFDSFVGEVGEEFVDLSGVLCSSLQFSKMLLQIPVLEAPSTETFPYPYNNTLCMCFI
jgi:hypothetical protein